jgi:hypothetical protein
MSAQDSLPRLSAILAVAAASQFAQAGPARAAPLAGAFSGTASTISASAVTEALAMQIGNAARETCPCRGTHGATRTATLSALSLGTDGSIMKADTSTATAYSDKTAHTATTTQSSTISHLNLLGGLITADTLTAVASVGATPETLTAADDGTQIVNLVIAGTPIDPATPDNTAIPLPGLGTVTVKAVTSHAGKQKAHEVVHMLLVDVSKSNTLGLPIGAKLVVATADASYDRVQPAAALAGFAAGTKVKGDAGNALDESAGAGSGIGLPGCAGTGGQTLSKTVSNVSLPGFLSAATETSTVFGGTVGTASVAKTTSTLADVSLLGGLISASTITAVAQESLTGTIDTPSTAGSGFSGLKVAGLPVPLNTPANTKLTLPGLGYVVVNEQLEPGPFTMTVNGLHVVVNSPNLLGLPVGTDITLGHANAVAKKF